MKPAVVPRLIVLSIFFILLNSIKFIPSVTAHSLILPKTSPTKGLTSLMSHSTVIKLHCLNFTVSQRKLCLQKICNTVHESYGFYDAV